jgi:hypothetical protein
VPQLVIVPNDAGGLEDLVIYLRQKIL